MSSSVIIVGSGFAGLSAASFMAKAGWQVTVIEKNSTPGGRAQQLNENGFSFDMGPSWYWMPDVFESYFEEFDPGAGEQLEKYLAEAAYKYETGINKLVYKPGRSFTEFIDSDIFKGV